MGSKRRLFLACAGLSLPFERHVFARRLTLPKACWCRKWTLLSADYRMIPLTRSHGMVEDASAAFAFSRGWHATKRRVIAAGSSGGKSARFLARQYQTCVDTVWTRFFLCCLTAHHGQDKPVAMLSMQGINYVRHRFTALRDCSAQPSFHMSILSLSSPDQ